MLNSELVPPEMRPETPAETQPANPLPVAPVLGGLRGVRGGCAPIVGDIVHVVSDDGVCAAGLVALTFKERPMDVLITLFLPSAGSSPMCIGLVKHGPDQKPRSWHDPQKCKGDKQPTKAKRLIG